MNCELAAIQNIFNFIWRDGRNVNDPDDWASLIQTLSLQDANDKLADPQIKTALRSNTDEAIARGVFGVPTLILDDELFWGHDAAEFALDFLKQPESIRREVFDPVSKFSQGAAQRKRS